MNNRKAIGYITANYASKHPSALLEERPLASLPFAGRYRLIDFSLSNMVNAGINTVGLVLPTNYRSLIDHLGSTKDWGLDRKRGGAYFMPGSPYGTSREGVRFLLRDIIASKSLFQRSDMPYVVMCGTNIIFNIDLNEVIAAHEASGAQITMAWTRAERSHVVDAMTVHFDEDNRVTSLTTGVQVGEPKFLECFVINRDLLFDIIDSYSSYDHLDLFEALGDELDRIDIRAYEFTGRALGIFDEKTYYDRSMDLLDPELSDQLFCPERPILTKAHDAPPAKYASGSSVRNSLISAECIINGTVEGSILSRKVTVEPGAVVKDTIIMQSCTIGSGARVEHAIIDKNNKVAPGTQLCGTDKDILVVRKGAIPTLAVR